MEPISTFLLGTVIGGILQNRSDAAFCEAVRLIRQRLRQAGEPVNHDLQRAVRKAYLQATCALIEARFQELGIVPDILRRIQHVLHPSEEIHWLDKVRGALRDELQRLPKAEYTPPAPEFEQEIELLLRPTSGRASERIDQFKTRLKQSLINELQKYGEPPARIKEMIQQGWQGEGGRQLDWFDLLCAFFSEELKQNQRVANIFQGQLLAQLVVEGVSIDWKDFSAQLDRFSRPILERLEQITKSLQSHDLSARALRLGFRVGQLDCILQTGAAEAFLPYIIPRAAELARSLGIQVDEKADVIIERASIWSEEIATRSEQTAFRLGRIIGGDQIAGMLLFAVSPLPTDVLRQATESRWKPCKELIEQLGLSSYLYQSIREVFEKALTMREQRYQDKAIAQFIYSEIDTIVEKIAEALQR